MTEGLTDLDRAKTLKIMMSLPKPESKRTVMQAVNFAESPKTLNS